MGEKPLSRPFASPLERDVFPLTGDKAPSCRAATRANHRLSFIGFIGACAALLLVAACGGGNAPASSDGTGAATSTAAAAKASPTPEGYLASLRDALKQAPSPTGTAEPLQAPPDREAAAALLAALTTAKIDVTGLRVGVLHLPGDDEVAVLVFDTAQGYQPADNAATTRLFSALAAAPVLAEGRITRVTIDFRTKDPRTGKLTSATETFPIATLSALASGSTSPEILKTIVFRVREVAP